MEMQKTNHAKFTFFYLLSLVSLWFMTFSTGMIIFQIINKYIVDVFEKYGNGFEQGAVKFGIAALLVAAPIYFIITKQIQKSLRNGSLPNGSMIRKWLTYLILFVSFVVSIGWLIGVLFSFLDGELTTKFLLKALTAIVLMAIVFTYYFYDIRRKEIGQEKDKVMCRYFWGSLVIVIATLISALLIVESPSEARGRRIDRMTIDHLSSIGHDLDAYYNDFKKLPESLEILKEEFSIKNSRMQDIETKEEYGYKILEDRKYEICANFRRSNQDEDFIANDYFKVEWGHEVGYKCFERNARGRDDAKMPIMDMRIID